MPKTLDITDRTSLIPEAEDAPNTHDESLEARNMKS